MPRAYPNADGELVKQCTQCNQIKPATRDYFQFGRQKSDKLKSWCKDCANRLNRLGQSEDRQRGLEIREAFIRSVGSKCQYSGCHMRYPDDLPGNFDLDHIDPRLKTGKKETDLKWIARNEKEFWERVASNLRLLCCHHHRVVTSEQHTFGGNLHQMVYGTADPAHMFNIPQDNHPVLFEWKASGGAACPTL